MTSHADNDPTMFTDREEAERALAAQDCPDCKLKVERLDAGQHVAFGISHQPGCPHYTE